MDTGNGVTRTRSTLLTAVASTVLATLLYEQHERARQFGTDSALGLLVDSLPYGDRTVYGRAIASLNGVVYRGDDEFDVTTDAEQQQGLAALREAGRILVLASVVELTKNLTSPNDVIPPITAFDVDDDPDDHDMHRWHDDGGTIAQTA